MRCTEDEIFSRAKKLFFLFLFLFSATLALFGSFGTIAAFVGREDFLSFLSLFEANSFAR